MADSVAVIMSTTGTLLLVTAYPRPLHSKDVSQSESSRLDEFLTYLSWMSLLTVLLARQFLSKSDLDADTFPLS